MSIINEALKKIEKEREGSLSADNAAKALYHAEIEQVKSKSIKQFSVRLIVIWSCGFIFVLALILILSQPRKRAFVYLSSELPEQKNEAAIQPAAPQGTEQKQSGSDGFVLNKIFEPSRNVPAFKLSGIMVSEAGPVAIINNEIVRKGDSIDGAIVELIESDQVKLSFQGQELVLTVK